VELLSDVEKIRIERRKAKANKHKFTGTGNDGFGLSFNSGGGRSGGFGSDSYSSGGSYGNGDYISFIMLADVALTLLLDYGSYGAGSSGLGSTSFRDDRRGFEEYNAGDDEISTPTTAQPRTQNPVQTPTRKTSASQPKSQPAPVEDLLGGFGDEDSTTNNGLGGLSMNKDLPSVSNSKAVAIDGSCC
jgi:epsin